MAVVALFNMPIGILGKIPVRKVADFRNVFAPLLNVSKVKKMLFVVKNYGRSGVVSHKMHVIQKAKESVCNLCVLIKMDNLPMEN